MNESTPTEDIFQHVRNLGLADGQYVVVGGGLLVALGLLEWDGDVDICISQEQFDIFKSQGWQQEEWKGKPVLKHGIYDVGIGFGDWNLEDLQADALVLQGIPFISPQKLIAWKQAMGRPKDANHVALLQKYLEETQK